MQAFTVMGQVVGPSKLIRADAAQVGDLVVFSYDDARALGIVFEFDEDREPLLGLVCSTFEVPRLLRLDGDTLCMDYGNEWALEPTDSPDTAPSRFETNRRAGLLVLTRNGWFMNFASSNVDQFGRFASEWRDMGAFKQSARVENAVAFDQWKLWRNLADRDHPNRRPLVTYKAEIQKGSQG